MNIRPEEGEIDMTEVVADSKMIACCGLYCGACKRYLKGGCPGCTDNVKATWCKIRTCCLEAQHASCADCGEYSDPNDCRKFNNLFSRAVSFLLRSDRQACIKRIQNVGPEAYAEEMAAEKRVTLKP